MPEVVRIGANAARVFVTGGIAKWHLIRAKIVIVESLGNYLGCRDSRKKPELRAIRGIAPRRLKRTGAPKNAKLKHFPGPQGGPDRT